MSGHSKWSSIKHKKGALDKKRSALFGRVSKLLMVAARSGPDPEMNPALRVAIEKAKQANMPKDRIEKAIKKGSGTLEGVTVEEVTYEGFGPDQLAVIAQVVTDNKNRTLSELKQIFTKQGGNLGSSNSVLWMFTQAGIITLDLPESLNEEQELSLIEAGADDFVTNEDQLIVYCEATSLQSVSDQLEKAGFSVLSSQMGYKANEMIEPTDKMTSFLETLEEQDDITAVFTNMKYA